MIIAENNLKIEYKNSFYDQEQSNKLFNILKEKIEWKQEGMEIYGKYVNFPRLTSYYGDKEYFYSGVLYYPLPWTEELLGIKKLVEDYSGEKYNSVLLQFYRNGNDYIGWHSDSEKDMVENAAIASVSFGAKRNFVLRPRSKDLRKKIDNINFELQNGDLLIMRDVTQKFWQHSITKSKNIKSERINLTFRLMK